MIKVLHYIPGFLYGGIESVFLSWYKNIDKSKLSFDLLLRTQDDDALALKEYKDCGGVYYRLPKLSKQSIFNYKKAVDKFFDSHKEYDIFHVHEAAPYVIMSAKRRGIKRIIIHSHTSNLDPGVVNKLRFSIEKISNRLYGDYGFACSKEAAVWKFGGLQYKGRPVKIIHNPIDVEKYKYNEFVRNKIRKQLGIKNDFVIGHVGRLTYPKNQFFLLDIFSEYLKKNKNASLIIVGDGPDEDKLKAYSIKLKIDDKVMFLGARNDVNILLQAMDFFLLPSKFEGLPLTLIEAQASGVQSLISDVVSEESDVYEVYRMSIKKSANEWADRIISIYCEHDRDESVKLIKKADFDVIEHWKYLFKLYLDVISN